MKQRVSLLFTILAVTVDALMAGLAFFLGYQLRLRSEYENIEPFSAYWSMLLIHAMTIVGVFFFYRLYHRRRTFSYVDQFYTIFAAVSIGTIIAIALISFVFKNQIDYSRLMMVYTWILTILLITVGRFIQSRIHYAFQAQGWSQERVLIVGAGEVGRLVL
jgi:FlaA1/EpsC-like NDP-sugar epimerase